MNCTYISDGNIVDKYRCIDIFGHRKNRYKNKNIDKYTDQTDKRLNCGICFHFSQFSQNFVFKKFPFYGTLALLTCSSIDPRKSHSEHLELPSLQYFKIVVPKNSQKWKFLFSQYSQNFFFPTYA